jgi:hypothetical protein
MIGKVPTDAEEVPKRPSSTRDAVETAIDLTKQDKSNPWAGFHKQRKKVSRWKPGESELQPK